MSAVRRSLAAEMSVQSVNKLFCVGSVNHARLRDSFASRSGAAEAVHTDIKEERRSFAVLIEDIADNGIFCDDHFKNSFFFGIRF